MRNPASTFSYYEDSGDPSGNKTIDNQIIYSRFRREDRKVVNKGISIKYVIEGEKSYRVNHQSYKVKSGEYLIINEGREVQCALESDHPTEGIWVYLSRGLIEEVYREIKSTLPDSEGIRLLDPAGKLELCEHVFTAQGNVNNSRNLERIGKNITEPIRDVNRVARNLAEGLTVEWQINRLTTKLY
jgi:hypothetical protein